MTGPHKAAEPGADEAKDADLDLDIKTIGAWDPGPQPGTEPLHDSRLAVAACGRPHGQPHVYITVDALEKITKHAQEDMRREVAGVLLGVLYTDRGKLVTEVRDSLAAPQTKAGRTHVTFSHDTWAAIFRQVEPAAGLSIVGWYHSHPGLGIFLSEQDVFIHENFFDNDGHVALVVDPVKHRIGVYVWALNRNEKRVVALAPGFRVTAPKEHAQRAHFHVARLHYGAAGEKTGPSVLARLLGRFTGAR